MRGAGCTWNDITDRDLDARVERTRSRPIPAGQVSVKQALVFLVLQALIGLAVLLQFNRFAVLTGIASLVIVAVYPFMKRITWWPQIVLGLAFSWGALMGFAVTFGRLDLTAFVLYAGSIAWVIAYDTIYAHQDTEDDALIGVKSTARLFAERTHQALVMFYGLAVVLIGVALALAGVGLAAWIGLAVFAAHLAWQVRRLENRRSRAVPAPVQVEPRCGAAVVCGAVDGCGDARCVICRMVSPTGPRKARPDDRLRCNPPLFVSGVTEEVGYASLTTLRNLQFLAMISRSPR